MGFARTWEVVAAAALVSFCAVACGDQPSKVAGAPSVPPNESYRLEKGDEEGFIWRCVNGERVRMSRVLKDKRPGEWVITRGPCGEPMPDEPPPVARRPMSGMGWW